jgi:hypothetical protein
MQNRIAIIIIMGYTKMMKFDNFLRFENVILRFTLLSLPCSSKYTLASIDSLHVCGTPHWLRLDLFSDSFENQNYDFRLFRKGIIGAHMH